MCLGALRRERVRPGEQVSSVRVACFQMMRGSLGRRTSSRGKGAVPEAAHGCSDGDSSDEEEYRWRRASEQTQPPPRSSDTGAGAGPSGHGPSTSLHLRGWADGDINDPRREEVLLEAHGAAMGDGERCRKEVLDKLDAARAAEEIADNTQRERAAKKATTTAERKRARAARERPRQADKNPSPPPPSAVEETPTTDDEEVRAPPALSGHGLRLRLDHSLALLMPVRCC